MRTSERQPRLQLTLKAPHHPSYDPRGSPATPFPIPLGPNRYPASIRHALAVVHGIDVRRNDPAVQAFVGRVDPFSGAPVHDNRLLRTSPRDVRSRRDTHATPRSRRSLLKAPRRMVMNVKLLTSAGISSVVTAAGMLMACGQAADPSSNLGLDGTDNALQTVIGCQTQAFACAADAQAPAGFTSCNDGTAHVPGQPGAGRRRPLRASAASLVRRRVPASDAEAARLRCGVAAHPHVRRGVPHAPDASSGGLPRRGGVVAGRLPRRSGNVPHLDVRRHDVRRECADLPDGRGHGSLRRAGDGVHLERRSQGALRRAADGLPLRAKPARRAAGHTAPRCRSVRRSSRDARRSPAAARPACCRSSDGTRARSSSRSSSRVATQSRQERAPATRGAHRSLGELADRGARRT